jgi:hypothetical protein
LPSWIGATPEIDIHSAVIEEPLADIVTPEVYRQPEGRVALVVPAIYIKAFTG